MKNKFVDLNNHLFEQLERLNDESLSSEKLIEEIQRAKAITGIASQIVANGNMVLNALKTKEEFLRGKDMLPEFFLEQAPTPTTAPQERKKMPESVKSEYSRL
ncbi:MAG: hypothetical protein WA125_17545 [Desulfosporosinus sp.]